MDKKKVKNVASYTGANKIPAYRKYKIINHNSIWAKNGTILRLFTIYDLVLVVSSKNSRNFLQKLLFALHTWHAHPASLVAYNPPGLTFQNNLTEKYQWTLIRYRFTVQHTNSGKKNLKKRLIFYPCLRESCSPLLSEFLINKCRLC